MSHYDSLQVHACICLPHLFHQTGFYLKEQFFLDKGGGPSQQNGIKAFSWSTEETEDLFEVRKQEQQDKKLEKNKN